MLNTPTYDFKKKAENMERQQFDALKQRYKNRIQGGFLIKILCAVRDKLSLRILEYYPGFLRFDMIQSEIDSVYLDICSHIVGAHTSNTLFMTDDEKAKLQKDPLYQKKLIDQVLDRIQLRVWGSRNFRQVVNPRAEQFLYYSVGHDAFVLASYLRATLTVHFERLFLSDLVRIMTEKVFGSLTLVEVGCIDNAYLLCRPLIELYYRYLIIRANPTVAEQFERFRRFEIHKNCYDVYPDDFNRLYAERCKRGGAPQKIEYFHYGWVDEIPEIANHQKPYSTTALSDYLLRNQKIPSILNVYYKRCHSYIHANMVPSIYPLQDYFEVCNILAMILLEIARDVKADTNNSFSVNGVDLIQKLSESFELHYEKYELRSTENYNAFYKVNMRPS